MRTVISISLLLVLVLAEMGASLVLLDFHLDRERIIAELCVEKDMLPEMQTCKGQCQLSKMLKQVTEGPDSPTDLELFEYAGDLLVEAQGVEVQPIVILHTDRLQHERTGFLRGSEPVPWSA